MTGRFRSGALTLMLGAVGAFALAPQSALGLFTATRSVPTNTISTSSVLAPTGLAASGSGSSVTLTWTATASTFAAGYDVLRSTTSGGPYTPIAQVTPRTTVTFADSTVTTGVTYYYVLRAYYQSWTSANTAEVAAATCTAGIVQSAMGGGTTNTISATFPSTPVPGRLLVAVAATRNAGSLTPPAGWSTAISQTNAGSASQAVFYKVAGASEPSTVSVAVGANGNGNGIHLYELRCVTAVDAIGSANGNSTAVSSGTVTTTQANTFVIAALVARQGNSLTSWTGGFTEVADFTQGAGGALTIFAAATLSAASTGSYATTATSNQSGVWRGQIVAFR